MLVPACAHSRVRVTVSPSTLECNEVGCCPGQTGCPSACSRRKCHVLMKCDKDGDDFKGADVNFSVEHMQSFIYTLQVDIA